MKIVIVGGGKVGAVLAGLLSQEDHDIVIIDTNQRVLEQLSNLYDVMAVTGNGATMRIQEDAGVKGADLLVAVTSDDLTNMLCCLVAKKSAPDKPWPAFATRNMPTNFTSCRRSWA